MRLQQIAKRDGRHADGIDGEEEETRIGVEQLATIGDQAGEIFLQPPHLAIGPAAIFGRIEQDAVISPGGGGYGEPWQREPELVTRDVARGYFTAADARRDYGVVVTGDDPPALDMPATETLRRGGRPKT